MDTRTQKEELRAKLLERRTAIDEQQHETLSAQIIQRLEQLSEFKQAEVIHCYVSMNDRREVDTHRLIKDMLANGATVVVPVTDFRNGTLEHRRLESFPQLEPNKWGVLEPVEGDPVSADALELVIVPMVGGDEQCNRMGYGEGFYDRFLKHVHCPKIGLLFEQNVVDELPVEEFDVPLDKIVTNTRIIEKN